MWSENGVRGGFKITGLRNWKEKIPISQEVEGSGSSMFVMGIDQDICVPLCRHMHLCV